MNTQCEKCAVYLAVVKLNEEHKRVIEKLERENTNLRAQLYCLEVAKTS
jgi:hypothetical protein